MKKADELTAIDEMMRDAREGYIPPAPSELARITAQRDELLLALQMMLALPGSKEARAQAQAAIAKAQSHG